MSFNFTFNNNSAEVVTINIYHGYLATLPLNSSISNQINPIQCGDGNLTTGIVNAPYGFHIPYFIKMLNYTEQSICPDGSPCYVDGNCYACTEGNRPECWKTQSCQPSWYKDTFTVDPDTNYLLGSFRQTTNGQTGDTGYYLRWPPDALQQVVIAEIVLTGNSHGDPANPMFALVDCIECVGDTNYNDVYFWSQVSGCGYDVAEYISGGCLTGPPYVKYNITNNFQILDKFTTDGWLSNYEQSQSQLCKDYRAFINAFPTPPQPPSPQPPGHD